MFGAFGEVGFGGPLDPAGPTQYGDNRKGVGAFGQYAFGQQDVLVTDGVELALVSDQFRVIGQAPFIRSGSRFVLAASQIVFSDQPVRVSISATVGLPDDPFLFRDVPPQITVGAIPADEIRFVDQVVSIRSGSRVLLAASQIVTNGPRIELNARRRRLKTTVVQS